MRQKNFANKRFFFYSLLAVIPEWSAPTDPRRNITIDMLLRMSSGIEFEENYRKYSDATRMVRKS